MPIILFGPPFLELLDGVYVGGCLPLLARCVVRVRPATLRFAMPLAAKTPSPAKARRIAGSDEAVDSLVKAGASAGRVDDAFMETVMRNNPGVGT